MSRGFVKEGDQEELPVVPPRAPLPAGFYNYVTPAGYQALLNERTELEIEYQNISKDNETEYRHATAFINGKLKLLNERIDTARILNPSEMPQNEVRFGALVRFEDAGEDRIFQIVGVDEANVKDQKIAFTSPLARALTGKKAGDIAILKHRRQTQKLKIIHISYPG